MSAKLTGLHGHQEGRFFHGYYDGYCYLPLYVFCGRHLLAAKLRRSNIDASAGAVEDYIYEPDAQSVLDELLIRYVETIVFQAVAENMASEQSAKMVAMKAASDNAKKLIEDLQLSHNKARQAAITQELSEIVGGAAAL